MSASEKILQCTISFALAKKLLLREDMGIKPPKKQSGHVIQGERYV